MTNASQGFKRLALAAIAAVVLLTGALNVRSVIGGYDNRLWDTDPSAPSPPTNSSASPLESRPSSTTRSSSARHTPRPPDQRRGRLPGLAYLQKVREIGDPSYYPKAEDLFERALDRNKNISNALVGLGTLALARHDFADALDWGPKRRHSTPIIRQPTG